MITDSNRRYIQFNHVILRNYKSKRFDRYAAKRFPKQDAHHILRRGIDYLRWGFKHTFHIQVVHQHRAKYFEENFERSLTIFIDYCINELKIPQEGLEPFLVDTKPETIKLFFDFVYLRENNV
jgi:hypothetical protein